MWNRSARDSAARHLLALTARVRGPIPETELDARFIHGRIEVAREYLRNGKIDKAAEILEDVVRTYPIHPETDAARLALKLLKRS